MLQCRKYFSCDLLHIFLISYLFRILHSHLGWLSLSLINNLFEMENPPLGIEPRSLLLQDRCIESLSHHWQRLNLLELVPKLPRSPASNYLQHCNIIFGHRHSDFTTTFLILLPRTKRVNTLTQSQAVAPETMKWKILPWESNLDLCCCKIGALNRSDTTD